MELTLAYNSQGRESDIDKINHTWGMLDAYIRIPDDSFRDIPVTAKIDLNMKG